MKIRHVLIFLVIAFVIGFIGALFKIMHWPGSDVILVAAMVLKVIAAVLLVFKVLSLPEVKKFINR